MRQCASGSAGSSRAYVKNRDDLWGFVGDAIWCVGGICEKCAQDSGYFVAANL